MTAIRSLVPGELELLSFFVIVTARRFIWDIYVRICTCQFCVTLIRNTCWISDRENERGFGSGACLPFHCECVGLARCSLCRVSLSHIVQS